MNSWVGNMEISNDGKAMISKYEVMSAFFRTEEEDDINMANELSRMINVFYDQERKMRRNVTILQFEMDAYGQAIDYIRQACG